MALVVDCLETFAVAQNRLYFEIQQDYKELLQVQKTVEILVLKITWGTRGFLMDTPCPARPLGNGLEKHYFTVS